MSLPRYAIVSIFFAAAATWGCGSNNSNSKNGGSGSGTGGTSSSTGGTGGASSCNPNMPPDPTGASKCSGVSQCVQQNCSTELGTCFGANFNNGDFSGGKCETYLSCTSKCKCDSQCIQACGTPDSTCLSCELSIASCETTKCAAQLKSCTGLGAGGAGGTSSSLTGGAGGQTP